jgi:hypothetical protein
MSTQQCRNLMHTRAAEPPTLSETGIFLVQPVRTLYFSSVRTMPVADRSIAVVAPRDDYPTREEIINRRTSALRGGRGAWGLR